MSDPINLHEYEARASDLLSPMVQAYYAGGANDEVSLAEAPRSWERLRLVPRVLVDVSSLDLSTTVLAQRVEFPVMTAPCALNRLAEGSWPFDHAARVQVQDHGQVYPARTRRNRGQIEVARI